MKQEITQWQWHQLDHMQIICTSHQTDNHASTWLLSFYRPDTLLNAQPTASKQRKQKNFSRVNVTLNDGLPNATNDLHDSRMTWQLSHPGSRSHTWPRVWHSRGDSSSRCDSVLLPVICQQSTQSTSISYICHTCPLIC